jgi:hypothetical protein
MADSGAGAAGTIQHHYNREVPGKTNPTPSMAANRIKYSTICERSAMNLPEARKANWHNPGEHR